MAKYRAIVSIAFDESGLEEIAREFGLDTAPDAMDTSNGALDDLEPGTGRVERLFVDGKPGVRRIGGGLAVEISEHDRCPTSIC